MLNRVPQTGAVLLLLFLLYRERRNIIMDTSYYTERIRYEGFTSSGQLQ